MHIIDLEHLESTSTVSEHCKVNCLIKGGARAFIQGYAYATTNAAAAAVLAGASGQQTFTTTNTLATTSLYPFYSTSHATASGYARGISPGSYASVDFNASADNTSFNGNSSSMGSSITSTTYKTW